MYNDLKSYLKPDSICAIYEDCVKSEPDPEILLENEWFERCKNDPQYFIEHTLIIPNKMGQYIPFKLNKVQKGIIDACCTQMKESGNIRIVIVKARQQGVTTLCRALMLWASLFHQTPGVLVAQTFDDLTKTFAGLTDLAKSIRRDGICFNNNRTNLEVNCHGYSIPVNGYWAGGQGEMRGRTYRALHLTEVDSYNDFNRLWLGVRETIPPQGFSMILIESTSIGHGNIYEIFNGDRRFDEFDKLFFPWYETEEYVSSIAAELDESDLEFQSKHGLSTEQMNWYKQKVVSKADIRIKHEYPTTLDDCFEMPLDNYFFEPKYIQEGNGRGSYVCNNDEDIILGIDPALMRDDTGMVWRQGRNILKIVRVPPVENSDKLLDVMAREIAGFRPNIITFDVTGNNYTLYNELQKRTKIHIIPINFGEAAQDNKVYENKRAELYARMKQWMREGCSFPSDQEFLQQLYWIKYDPSSHRLKLIAKKDMPHSPDLADACAMTFPYAGMEYPGISRSSNYGYKTNVFEEKPQDLYKSWSAF